MSLQAMPATREAWLALRQGYVGASEVAALWGLQAPYQSSLYTLWHVKGGHAPEPDASNPRTAWGLKLEEVVAMAAAEENGWTVTRGRYASDPRCGLGASLDFEIEADPTGEFQGRGVLETKNVDWLVHRRSWADGEPPMHIMLQLQAQLAATGWTWGAVASLVGGNRMEVYRFQARPKLIAEIRQRCAAFWASVEAGTPPPVDGSTGAAAVIRSLYPEMEDELVDLRGDNEMPEICAQLLDAGERRRAAERDEDEAKNRLAAKIETNRRAMAQGFWINVAVTPEKLPGVVTAEMIGAKIPGRKEARRYTVKPMEQQEAAA